MSKFSCRRHDKYNAGRTTKYGTNVKMEQLHTSAILELNINTKEAKILTTFTTCIRSISLTKKTKNSYKFNKISSIVRGLV